MKDRLSVLATGDELLRAQNDAAPALLLGAFADESDDLRSGEQDEPGIVDMLTRHCVEAPIPGPAVRRNMFLAGRKWWSALDEPRSFAFSPRHEPGFIGFPLHPLEARGADAMRCLAP
jgi:hypothetical protein